MQRRLAYEEAQKREEARVAEVGRGVLQGWAFSEERCGLGSGMVFCGLGQVPGCCTGTPDNTEAATWPLKPPPAMSGHPRPQTLRKQREKDEELQRLQEQRDAENARRALERKLELKTKTEEVGGGWGSCCMLRDCACSNAQICRNTGHAGRAVEVLLNWVRVAVCRACGSSH